MVNWNSRKKTVHLPNERPSEIVHHQVIGDRQWHEQTDAPWGYPLSIHS